MTVKVLVVDDSGFFRRRLSEIIDSCNDLTVVGTANNGREAIDQVIKLKPDVITMDYEMPVMDGITSVRHIMQQHPTPILMFSSLTYEGARVTLDSLDAGAVDYLLKNFEEISKNSAILTQTLEEKLIAVACSSKGKKLSMQGKTRETSQSSFVSAAVQPLSRTITSINDVKPYSGLHARKNSRPYKLVAIGTSTGGPVALQCVLADLPADFPLPLILIQHMPSTFTNAFAQRLDNLCNIKVKEAEDGDTLTPGVALLAPGGKQTMVSKGGGVKVLPGDDRLNYKPSIDVTFGSAANVFDDSVIGLVLTGMGSDGCEGAKLLKQKGSKVWAQDEDTSVIYGMPMMVAKANLVDEVLPIQNFATRLCEVV